MRYPSSLTTAEAVGRQIVKPNPGDPTNPAQSQYDDYYDYISEVVPQVSAYIETECDRSFVPYYEAKTLYFNELAENRLYDPRTRLLTLPDDLLVISSVTWGGTLLSASDYRTQATDRAYAWGILFNPAASLSWSSDFADGIIVAGTWGYHNSLNAYTTVGTVTIGNDTVTSVTVSDSTPYEVWQYVRCQSELMQITDKPNATTLTVIRGVNGTTAAAHTAQALQTYMPVKDIRLAATRLAAFMFEKRTDVGGVVQIGDASFRLDELPPAVKEAINRHKRWTFGHV